MGSDGCRHVFAIHRTTARSRACSSHFGAFLIAANGTLFGIHTNWSWYAWVAAASEVVAVVVGVVAAAREGYLSRTPGRMGAGSA